MIEINTSEYVFAYGHNPRGRDSWAFQIGYREDEIFWSKPYQLYSQALADAAPFRGRQGQAFRQGAAMSQMEHPTPKGV